MLCSMLVVLDKHGRRRTAYEQRNTQAGTEFVQPAKGAAKRKLAGDGLCGHMRLKSLGLAELGQAARSRSSR